MTDTLSKIRFNRGDKADLATRFWAKVELKTGDECWPWLAGVASKTHNPVYGAFDCRGAHITAFELTYGPVPEGKIVRHTCDFAKCCNPVHLVLGTHADNARDRVERNRCGKILNRVLTLEQKRAIVMDQRRQVDIAADYGVSQPAISHIKVNATRYF